MSTWATPITFTGGAGLTAAQLNTGRDNLNFLKGALDLLTGGTTADVGTGMMLDLEMAATTSIALAARVTADPFPRVELRADGQLQWLTQTTGDVEQIMDPNATIRRVIFRGQLAGVPANNQLAVELAAVPGAYNAIFVWANGDTGARVSLGTTAGDQGRLAFGGGAGGTDAHIWRNSGSEIWTTDTFRAQVYDAAGTSDGILRAATDLGYYVLGTKVVGRQKTGWSAPSGTSTRTTFATSTVTVAQLAERVKALLEDLGETTGHGLIDV